MTTSSGKGRPQSSAPRDRRQNPEEVAPNWSTFSAGPGEWWAFRGVSLENHLPRRSLMGAAPDRTGGGHGGHITGSGQAGSSCMETETAAARLES